MEASAAAKKKTAENVADANTQKGRLELQKTLQETINAKYKNAEDHQKALFEQGVDPVTGDRLNLSNAPDEALIDGNTKQPIPTKMLSTLKPSMQETNRADFAKSTLHTLDMLDLTERQLRLVPALIGAATVLLLGSGAEMFGFTACLVAGLLFAFAPLPVYYNRYFIHETMFVAATLGLILSGWRAGQKKSLWPAALAGGCAALMLAAKETAILHFFALVVAGLGCRFFDRRKKFAAMIPPPKIQLTAFAVFLFVGILLFTWFGRNWGALAGLGRAISFAAARADGEGHAKPFWYYLQLLGGGWSGSAVLVLAALGMVVLQQ